MTWDGPEVKYLETLFIPIFKELQEKYGYEFHVMQFIWGADEIIQQRKKKFSKLGIPYQAFIISHHYPVLSLLKAVLFDSFNIRKYIKKHVIEVIMPRATTSMAIVNRLVQESGLKLVFDADGFSQDERVDFSGLSPLSLRYRIYRDFELKGYHLSNSIICRSSGAKKIITDRSGAGFDPNKIFVVHNGTYASMIQKNNPGGKEMTCRLVYIGSIGPQYRVHDMLAIFGLIIKRIPLAQMTILTAQVNQVSVILKRNFPELEKEVTIKTVSAEEVGAELSKHDIGISLRQESFSIKGVAPIKVSEYLSAGLSLIYSPGIGDMDELLEGKPFAFCFRRFSSEESRKLEVWVQEQLKVDQSREVSEFAQEVFSLSRMVQIYNQALQYG